MACTFETQKKEVRIEIPSPLRMRDLLGHGFLHYLWWCVASLFASWIRAAQGFESVPYLAALAGAAGCVPLYLWLCWTDSRVKDWRCFLRDQLLFLAIIGIVAFIYCAIWREPVEYWQIPPGLWLILFLGTAGQMHISVMMTGYRDEIVIRNDIIEIVRSWPLHLYQQVFHIDRNHYEVELVHRTWEGRTGPPGIPLDHVLFVGGGRPIQLGLMQSEEDLRRIYELLEPQDVIASGEGIWEFSDPYLRRVSKGEEPLMHANEISPA